MNYIPFNYEQINMYEATFAPQNVNAENNITTPFWQRMLFQSVMYLYDFTLPEDWPKERADLFKWLTFRYGYNIWVDTAKYGLLAQPGTLGGISIDYGPSYAIVNNPNLNFAQSHLIIGLDCAVFKLSPDYIGVWDIVTFYAEKMASLSSGVDMSILNGKLAKVFAAKNKSAAQTLKAVEDEIQKGNGLVITNQNLISNGKGHEDDSPIQELDFGLPRDKYLLTQQLQDLATLYRLFCNEIGLATVPYEKKERMTAYESESTKVESQARCKVWLDNMNESFTDINKLFGTSCSVKLAIEAADNLVDGEEDRDNVMG